MLAQTRPRRRSTRSTRCATQIPALDWVSMGYNNETAQVMENFTFCAQHIEVANGSQPRSRINLSPENFRFQDFITNYRDPHPSRHGAASAHAPQENNYLPFHELMLPHWKKVVKLLEDRVKSIVSIKSVHLPPVVLQMIEPTLPPNLLTSLELQCNNLGSEGILALSNIILHTSSLTKLVICENKIDDVNAIEHLSSAVKSHPSLVQLQVVNCGLGTHEKTLPVMLEGCKNLKRLILSNNGIASPRAATSVAKFIEGNSCIQQIDLKQNNFSDIEAISLANALRNNNSLQLFDLRQNEFTVEGKKVLMKSVFNAECLDTVAVSNHLCCLKIDVANTPFEKEVRLVNSSDAEEPMKIRVKTVLALCNSNEEVVKVQYLNDTPITLMPFFLEWVQKTVKVDVFSYKGNFVKCHIGYEEQLDSRSLGRLYHVLKQWKMPMLFERRAFPTNKRPMRKRKRVR